MVDAPPQVQAPTMDACACGGASMVDASLFLKKNSKLMVLWLLRVLLNVVVAAALVVVAVTLVVVDPVLLVVLVLELVVVVGKGKEKRN